MWPLQLASSGSLTAWVQSSGCSKKKAGRHVFAAVAWPRATSDFRGGQTDCTSGWKELLSHAVKGHSLRNERVYQLYHGRQ